MEVVKITTIPHRSPEQIDPLFLFKDIFVLCFNKTKVTLGKQKSRPTLSLKLGQYAHRVEFAWEEPDQKSQQQPKSARFHNPADFGSIGDKFGKK